MVDAMEAVAPADSAPPPVIAAVFAASPRRDGHGLV
jgi:hypothetical protein